MSTAHDRWLEAPYADDDTSAMEAREAAIRQRIESDPVELGEAVADYYSGIVRKCDGSDLLTEFTLALAGAEKLMDIIAHGDPLPDAELQAFRYLCRQIEEAKRRQAQAITDAVEGAL